MNRVVESLLPFKLKLQPGETAEIEVSPANDLRFRLRRLMLSGVRRRHEIWRHGRKGWRTGLVVYGPPVEILNIKIDNREALAPDAAAPALLFTAAATEVAPFDVGTQPALVFTMIVRSLSDRPYTLHGAFVGTVARDGVDVARLVLRAAMSHVQLDGSLRVDVEGISKATGVPLAAVRRVLSEWQS